jgi:hypothetical protein
MAERYRTADGWSVEAITLTATPDHHDGEWLRVRYHGYHVVDAASVDELARYFSLGDLELDALMGRSRMSGMMSGAPRG